MLLINTLQNDLQPGELENWCDMGVSIYAKPIDGKFSTESPSCYISPMETAPDGFENFGEVDWLMDCAESFDRENNVPKAIVNYINELAEETP